MIKMISTLQQNENDHFKLPQQNNMKFNIQISIKLCDPIVRSSKQKFEDQPMTHREKYKKQYLEIPTESQASIMTILSTACTVLREQTYLGLLSQQPRLNQVLKIISQQTKQLPPNLMEVLIHFLSLVRTKIAIHPTALSLYTSLLTHCSQLQQKLAIKIKAAVIEKEQMSDLLFTHFEKYCQANQKLVGNYLIADEKTKNKKNISEFINEYRQEYLHPAWLDTFALTENQFSQVSTDPDPQAEDYAELPFERTQALDCIGCSPFFYMNTNVLSECNQSKIALCGPVYEINKNRELIKQEICALMNSRGGCILFDTECVGLKVFPRGQFLTGKEKEQIQQQILGIISEIHPKPMMNDVDITFIPMIKDPKVQAPTLEVKKTQNGRSYFVREYIEGLYVLRLRVSPHCASKFYSFTRETNECFPVRQHSIGISSKFKRILSHQQALRQIKTRMQQYENQQNLSEQELFFIGSNFTDFDHICTKPDVGLPITQKNATSTSSSLCFKQGSLLIADRANHTIIRSKLKKYGIDCIIELPSSRHHFKNSGFIALIRHDAQFDTLLTAINNPEFHFGVKTAVINMTEYIHLSERSQFNTFPEDDFRSLEEWMTDSYPKESLTLWKFRSQDMGMDEYYLKTESMESAMLIFLVLQHFGEKVLMKNPKNWKKMTAEEKKEKLVRVKFRLIAHI